MKTYIKENTWLSGMEHGWGNGYVLIPKGHPMHGVDYEDIDVNVHGGLTFSKKAEDCITHFDLTPEDKECWIVGFDTAHYQDNQSNWNKQRVQEEVEDLAKQLEAIK